MANRIGGTCSLTVNGEKLLAKGDFEYNFGAEERVTVIGVDDTHGYLGSKRPPHIKGKITVASSLDVAALVAADGVNVQLDLDPGYATDARTLVLRDAWFSGEGTVNVQEGTLEVMFTGRSLDLVAS